jgi:hypothetical protein
VGILSGGGNVEIEKKNLIQSDSHQCELGGAERLRGSHSRDHQEQPQVRSRPARESDVRASIIRLLWPHPIADAVRVIGFEWAGILAG